jgi:putative phosphoribosyl transferase
MSFANRTHAGRLLAGRLKELNLEPDSVILALPRGGIPVGVEISRELGLPLDVLVVRKVGAPGDPEYGLGAITEGGLSWIDWPRAESEGITAEQLAPVKQREQEELERRVRLYRGDRERLPVSQRTVILVDDGLATGGTAHAACKLLRQLGARRVILAVPVCPARARSQFREDADDFVCLAELDRMISVGQHYEDFSQVDDEDVTEGLNLAASRLSRHQPIEVRIRAPGVQLPGLLTLPDGARGLVLFAHGSGSNRMSPRNQAVARLFERAGLATLLFDLLTPRESEEYEKTFDIPLLAKRIELATQYVDSHPNLKALPLGYYGASTGAAAAFWAAAELGPRVSAFVSRGGRPDLAIPRLRAVTASTLLIVGELDTEVLALNRKALTYLERGRLAVIPGATHLFEEPGTLEQAGRHAFEWFERHLLRRGRSAA